MRINVVFAACCAVLAGCSGGSGGGGGAGLAYEYSTACMFEVDAPGAYVFSDGDDQVTAGGGATKEGAAALNACIQRKAAAAGKTALPDVAGVPQSVTTKTEGTKVTETFTYGTPPPQKSGIVPAESSALPKRVAPKVPQCNLQMVGGSGYVCARN